MVFLTGKHLWSYGAMRTHLGLSEEFSHDAYFIPTGLYHWIGTPVGWTSVPYVSLLFIGWQVSRQCGLEFLEDNHSPVTR